jgi:phosphoserine aminotransferase
MKKHNFFAGPSLLSDFAVQKSAEAVLNFDNTGMSILCISHREKSFIAVMEQAVQAVKDLLDVPSGYSVLFLQGGASTQFTMAPMNILATKAAYINTGAWSAKAIKEAKFFGQIDEIASSKDDNYTYIPKNWESKVTPDYNYCHITTNNTIFGTQFKADPSVCVPLVADMSSDIFSRPIDVSKYGIIYAGAQKNLGPSGIVVTIVKDELLGKVDRKIPTILDYTTHIKNESMFNTPPTLATYTCLQSLIWFKQLGGVAAIEKLNAEKTNILYDEIDSNKLFRCPVTVDEDRSMMNVCFVMNEEYKELEAGFLKLAQERGIVGIKGHRSVGGFRASTYNAQTKESIAELVKAMKDYEKTV